MNASTVVNLLSALGYSDMIRHIDTAKALVREIESGRVVFTVARADDNPRLVVAEVVVIDNGKCYTSPAPTMQEAVIGLLAILADG